MMTNQQNYYVPPYQNPIIYATATIWTSLERKATHDLDKQMTYCIYKYELFWIIKNCLVLDYYSCLLCLTQSSNIKNQNYLIWIIGYIGFVCESSQVAGFLVAFEEPAPEGRVNELACVVILNEFSRLLGKSIGYKAL